MKNQVDRLNEVIRLIMRAKNYRVQTPIIEDLGYSASFFCNVTKGNVPMSMKFINEIKRVYPFVNIDYILSGQGRPIQDESISGDISQEESLIITRRQIIEMTEKIQSLIDYNKSLSESINALIKDNAELKQLLKAKL